MHIEEHEEKIRKLDNSEDHITIVETAILLCSHYANAAMHRLKTLKPDTDIKHNHLAGELRRGQKLGEKSAEVAALLDELEELRTKHVYGKGQNGDTSRQVKEILDKVKTACGVTGDESS